MINILLSIRENYSELIFEKIKRIELRKTLAYAVHCLDEGVTLYHYSSGKHGKHAITGYSRVNGWEHYTEGSPEVADEACVSYSQLDAYLPCYGWHVYGGMRFKNNVQLKDVGFKRPPQSWQYLSDDQAALIEKLRWEAV